MVKNQYLDSIKYGIGYNEQVKIKNNIVIQKQDNQEDGFEGGV